MAVAHLIHGFLGAGKTTLARRLERDCRALRFSHDEWMVRLYGRDPPAAEFAALHDRVSAQIDALWPRCLELGVDVVLDLGFWTRAQRDETRRIVSALGATERLYALAVPDAVALARLDGRNAASTSDLIVSRSTFQLLRGRFEPLAADELGWWHDLANGVAPPPDCG